MAKLFDLGPADRTPRLEAYIPGPAQRPHPPRRRAIIAAHPDVAALIGHDPLTFVITLGIVGFQILMAAWMGSQAWWVALIAAYCIGAFANHALYVVIHDACHNCIFASVRANKWAGIVADLPNTVPTAIGFRNFHIKHHSHLGDYDYDADLPSHWEARVFGRTWYGKAAWMFLFPVFQGIRLPRLKATVPMWGRWTFINLACVVLFDLAILLAFGPIALLYLFASFWFSVGGLHPLGARWIQEHFTPGPEQETYDYYGPLNVIALNIGYHNEHHDFPDVPWHWLPCLKAMAPEFYNDLKYHRSWFKLFAAFITDPRFTLYTRLDRSAASLASPEACMMQIRAAQSDAAGRAEKAAPAAA